MGKAKGVNGKIRPLLNSQNKVVSSEAKEWALFGHLFFCPPKIWQKNAQIKPIPPKEYSFSWPFPKFCEHGSSAAKLKGQRSPRRVGNANILAPFHLFSRLYFLALK